MRRLLLLAPLCLVLSACGSSNKQATFADAVSKTQKQSTEHVALELKVVARGQTLSFSGGGDFDTNGTRGAYITTLSSGGQAIEFDEIIDGTKLYLSSPMFTSTLPSGKDWLMYDSTVASSADGFNFNALTGISPGAVLTLLENTAPPQMHLGSATVDGVHTLHWQSTYDTSKLEKAIQKTVDPVYKTFDVWIDDEGLVRKVVVDFTAKQARDSTARAHVTLTMILSKFGAEVSVPIPTDAQTVDATAAAG